MKAARRKGGLFPVLQTGDKGHPFQDPLWDPENKEKKGANWKILLGENWQNLVTD